MSAKYRMLLIVFGYFNLKIAHIVPLTTKKKSILRNWDLIKNTKEIRIQNSIEYIIVLDVNRSLLDSVFTNEWKIH